MVFEENYRGVDYAKALLHSKRWYVYLNEKEKLVKGIDGNYRVINLFSPW